MMKMMMMILRGVIQRFVPLNDTCYGDGARNKPQSVNEGSEVWVRISKSEVWVNTHRRIHQPLYPSVMVPFRSCLSMVSLIQFKKFPSRV